MIGGSAFLSFGLSVLDLGWLADNILALLVASLAISIAMSIWLYFSSFQGRQKLLSEGGDTGVSEEKL